MSFPYPLEALRDNGGIHNPWRFGDGTCFFPWRFRYVQIMTSFLFYMGDDSIRRWTSRFFSSRVEKTGETEHKTPKISGCIIPLRLGLFRKLVPSQERVLVNEAHVFMYFNSWGRKATLLGVINKIWSRRTCGKQQQPRWRRRQSTTTTTTTPIIFFSMTKPAFLVGNPQE